MAKIYSGTLPISQIFKVSAAAPIDDRLVVNNVSDLTNADTWKTTGNNIYTYKGMIVSVPGDGVYMLNAEANLYGSLSNWKKISSDISLKIEGGKLVSISQGGVPYSISNEGRFVKSGLVLTLENGSDGKSTLRLGGLNSGYTVTSNNTDQLYVYKSNIDTSGKELTDYASPIGDSNLYNDSISTDPYIPINKSYIVFELENQDKPLLIETTSLIEYLTLEDDSSVDYVNKTVPYFDISIDSNHKLKLYATNSLKDAVNNASTAVLNVTISKNVINTDTTTLPDIISSDRNSSTQTETIKLDIFSGNISDSHAGQQDDNGTVQYYNGLVDAVTVKSYVESAISPLSGALTWTDGDTGTIEP